MANEGLADQVKLSKELRGLMSDVGRLSVDIRKSGEEHKDILGGTVAKTQALVKHQAMLAREGRLTLEESKKYYQQVEKLKKQGEDRVALQQSFNDASAQSANRWQDMQMQAAAFAGRLWGIVTNPLVLLLVGVALIGKMFVDWNKRGEEFRQTTGIVGDQFAKLNEQAMGVAAELGHLGISQKEALEYTQALTEEFGSIEFISRELVRNTAILSVTMGISADESVKLMSSIMSITAGSEEMATNMIKFTSTLSESVGVARNMVMKDIAENAEALAGYMKDSGKNIVVAAVQARQLGVSIGTVVSAADKLLEFESSIEAQMNAMVLTGRQINTERARSLALEGDLAGLQREILSQVGTQADFEEMNVIQRRALAEAFGMNVGELGKMISRQELLTKLTKGQISAAEAMAKGMTLTEVLGTNKQVMSGLTQLTNALVKLGNFVATFLVPTFTVLAGLFGVIADAMNWVFDGISKVTTETEKSAAENESWIMIGFKFLVTAGLITVAIIGIRKAMAGLGKVMKFPGAGKGGMFGNIFGGLSWSSIAKGAVLMVVLAGSIFLLGKALQTFADVTWEDLAIAGVAIFGLTAAMFALGSLLAGPQLIAIGIAVGVIAALGGAFIILGTGISSIGNGLDSIATGLERIIELSSQLSVIEDVVSAVQKLAEPVAVTAATVGAVRPVEIPTVGGGIPAAGTAAMATTPIIGGTEVNVSLDDVVKKLDDIETLFVDGIDLKLNGAKFGEWLSKEARKA
jgi:hypothetical protein